MNDGHAEKSRVVFFAGLRKIAVMRIFSGIVDIDGFFTHPHHANQAFRKTQAYRTDRLRIESFGGHEYVTLFFEIGEVNGTDVRIHGVTYPAHDDVQGLLKIAGSTHLLNNAAQNIEHDAPDRSTV